MPGFDTNGRASLAGALFVFCAGILIGTTGPGYAAVVCAPDRIDAQVHVRQVIDGDTVRLSDERHLRLIGVDTPELAHDGSPAQPLGIEARDRLRQLLAQHQNTLNLRYDVERHDHYGRLLAHAFLTDGSSIEAWLQKQGLGTVLVVPPNEWNLACYLGAEQRAREKARGIWALPGYRIVESTRIGPAGSGYHLIAGRVQHVGTSRHAVWLNLEGSVTLRIDRDDLPNFRAWHPQDQLGKRVLARGWLHRSKGGTFMSIRHPAALQVLNP